METASTPLSSRETALPLAPTNILGPASKSGHIHIGLLGPFETFTEQAIRQIAPVDAELVPITSAPRTLAALCRGEMDRAVAPIENSIESGVNVTLDSLAHGNPFAIIMEMIVPIVFQLVVRPDTRPEDVHKIGTHPHAWAQCRNQVEQTFPGAIHVPTISTVAGVQLLANGNASFDAALCSVVSVDTYGVESPFRDIVDNPNAMMHFVPVTPPKNLPASTGADKTTIQVILPINGSGTLLILLEQSTVRGIDLSRIESRPSGGVLDDCTFSIDIAGHAVEEQAQTTLAGLYQYSPGVRFMGSCPGIDGRRSVVLPGTKDEDF